MTDETKQLMVMKKETADVVLAKIDKFVEDGELSMPDNYNQGNAIHGAWLILQQMTVKRNNKDVPVLEVCTKASIANTLLDMVVQGLSPTRKQCYMIPYGEVLTLQRSYFGAKAVAMRLNPQIRELYAEVVYEGDDLEYSIINGVRVIEKHTQSLSHIDDEKMIGAYAVAIGQDGSQMRSELMTIDQIKQSWI